MDSQGSANSMAESASDHGKTMVKPNAPLPQQGFQARPQGPPSTPRNSINNGPVGAPRPGQPLRRLDSRSTLGPPPASGQFVQLRPYGPPRPPGGAVFPPRPPQPGQLPPQNQRFAFSPGIRGPPPQTAAAVQRPPFVGNQQAYQAQQQQQQRISNDPRFQRPPDIAPQNGPQRQPGQESFLPRQLLRNDSLLTLQRQHLLSNEEIKQPTRPRIVIEKMADINESEIDKPEGYLQRKKSDVRENGENDDDDDVVMDSEKSPRRNSAAEGLVNGSKSPRKLDDTGKPASRPDTATIKDKEEKVEDKQDVPSRPISAMGVVDVSTPVVFQSRPSSAINDDKEKKLETKFSSLDKASRSPSAISISEPAEMIKMSSTSPYRKDAPVNIEKNIDNSKTPPKSSDISRSATPSRLDAEREMKTPNKSRSGTPAGLEPPGLESSGNAEQESKSPDKSRASTPASGLSPSPNAERETLKTPSKTPDRSRSGTPAGLESPGNAEQESKSPDKSRASTPASGLSPSPNVEKETLKTPSKTPDRSRSSTPAALEPPGNAEQESKSPDKSRANTPAGLEPPGNAEQESKSPDKSRASTPAGAEASSDEAESVKHSEESTLQVKQSSRPASSLGSPSSMKDSKSPKSPRSPEEGVKGFDNGQQRSLSSSSLQSPKSPAASAKSSEGEKKRTSFVEDVKKTMDVADKIATSPSKPATPAAKTPRAQTPTKLDDGKREKKSSEKKAIQNGSTSESQANATTNGVADSPTKKSKDSDKRSTAGSPTKSPSKSAKSLPRTPDTPSSTAQDKKKLPMNKVQVGAAPSPNLKTIRSKIGSLDNASYKPGGGKVKIENRKLDFGSKAQPKIAAKNDKYTPSGGDKKIAQVKLQWNAKSKVGSLDNTTYKPGGGDKKIETVKLDFKDKAKPKVGSKDNAKHVPGGGAIKSATPPKTPQETKNDIPMQKIEIKAESKIGSLDNMKHKPGGGDKKIFNDRDYLRQTSSNVESVNGSGSQAQTPVENSKTNDIPEPHPPPTTPTKTRSVTPPSSIVTPQAVKSGLAKSPEATTPKRQHALEAEGSILANGRTSKTPSPDAINDKNTTKDRSSRSPISPRPPSSLRVKSAGDKSTPSTSGKTSPGTPRTSPLISNKTSPATPRKTPSPKALRLPKLAPSPIPQEASPATTETQVKISLPKLMEPSSQVTRMAY